MDGIQTAANQALEAAQPALFGLGFIFGATEGDATWHAKHEANAGYSSNIIWRIKDTLGHLGIGGVDLGTDADGRSYVSKAGALKLKPLGFLNKGLAAAVGVWFYKEAKLPYSKEIYKGVFPFATGYSFGGIVDPPGASSTRPRLPMDPQAPIQGRNPYQ